MIPTFPLTLAVLLTQHLTLTLQTVLHHKASNSYTSGLGYLLSGYQPTLDASQLSATYTHNNRQTDSHFASPSRNIVPLGDDSLENSSDFSEKEQKREINLDNLGLGAYLHPQQKKWGDFAVWGKRNALWAPQRRRWLLSLWGKRSSGFGVSAEDQIDSNCDNDSGCQSKKWKPMSIWGKRSEHLSLNKRWKQMAIWGKRSALGNEMKRWKQMSLWGKRSSDQEFSNGLRELLASLQKRDNEIAELSPDKKWKQMSLWGKRGSDIDVDDLNNDKDKEENSIDTDETMKRWGHMSSWGKRSWPVKKLSLWRKRWSNMSSWGKRSAPSSTSHTQLNSQNSVSMKKRSQSPNHELWRKRWASMSAWGKRSSPSSTDQWELQKSEPIVKRSLLENYEGEDEDDTNDIEKRRSDWRQLSLWGKRTSGTGSEVNDIMTSPEVEKKWSYRSIRRNRPMRRKSSWDMWGKRPSWRNSGFTSWGKRSGVPLPTIDLLHSQSELDLSNKIKDIILENTKQSSEVIDKAGPV